MQKYAAITRHFNTLNITAVNITSSSHILAKKTSFLWRLVSTNNTGANSVSRTSPTQLNSPRQKTPWRTAPWIASFTSHKCRIKVYLLFITMLSTTNSLNSTSLEIVNLLKGKSIHEIVKFKLC